MARAWGFMFAVNSLKRIMVEFGATAKAKTKAVNLAFGCQLSKLIEINSQKLGKKSRPFLFIKNIVLYSQMN